MISIKKIKVLGLGIVTGMAFLAGCTHDNPLPPTLYERADAINGGVMYDKFWAVETGFDQEDSNIGVFEASADFFRCNQCHGWDGLGAGGAFIERELLTSRPNAANKNLYQVAQEKSEDELFEAIKSTVNRRDMSANLSSYDPSTNNTEGDKMPNYSQILTDRQIWDLVKFLKEGMFDVSQLYDAQYDGTYPNGTATFSNLGKDGDENLGNAFYAENCAGCHGADGLFINLNELGLGGYARSMPYILHHKAKFGNPGSDPQMLGANEATVDELKDLYKALSNETNFPTDIPVIVSFTTDIQPIFTAKCILCHSVGNFDLSEGNAYNSINKAKYINLTTPNQSLIYTKPLPSTSHGGTYSSGEAEKLLRWIEQGAMDN